VSLLCGGVVVCRLDRLTLRHYEREGLLCPAGRTAIGYRLYDERSIRIIYFIRHAQECGFTLAEIGQILQLRNGAAAACPQVHDLLIRKRRLIEEKLKSLTDMRDTLERLAAMCVEEGKPLDRCPVFDALETPPPDCR
jgi:DNA-binding transcriptional MerR regulator